jgi:hypothetical protein
MRRESRLSHRTGTRGSRHLTSASLLLCIGAVVGLAPGCGRNEPAATTPAATAPDQSPPSAAAAGAAPATPPPPANKPSTIHFTDVTAESGLVATMTAGGTPSTQILEVKGAGLALFDIDNDGDLDVFMPNGATLADPQRGPGARLFENVSVKPGEPRFRDVTESSGIALRRWSFGVAVGDVDGDGREDVYVCCYGPDVLLRNATEPGGALRFVDATAESGIVDDAWGAAAAFGDLDGDGDLDLYVANYLDFDTTRLPGPTIFKSIPVMSGPFGLPATPDILYENVGGGRFRDVSEASGIRAVAPGYGLNVAILDFTGDGRADIYVGNDSQVKNFFRNTGPRAAGEGTALAFEDIALAAGVATNIEGTEQATMGVAVGDVDGNGWPDLFTTNFSSDTNTLHLNLDGKFFEDRTQQFGLGAVSRPFLGWACGLFDLDHDADEDLLIVNGHVYPQATKGTMDSEYEQTPLLFERRGKRFERVGPERAGAWLGEAHRDRTAAFGDLDGDGDIDVIVGELNGPLRVLRNDVIGGEGGGGGEGAATHAPWVAIALDDPKTPGNRRGVGALVECRSGDLTQRRWIYGGGPFMSNIVPQAHFGLPAAAGAEGATVDVTVTWPDGVKETRKVNTGTRERWVRTEP